MATVSRAAAGALVKQGYPMRTAATAVVAERRDRIIESPQCKIPRRHITKKPPGDSRLGARPRKTSAVCSLRATPAVPDEPKLKGRGLRRFSFRLTLTIHCHRPARPGDPVNTDREAGQ